VFGDTDGLPVQVDAEQIAEMGSRLGPRTEWQPEHLVEVAIVHVSLPVDTDEAPAHYLPEVLGPMRAAKQRPIALKTTLRNKGAAEALNGHIREGKKTIEYDAVTLTELPVISLFQLGLRRREFGPVRVEH
jgi:hypothetical protein